MPGKGIDDVERSKKPLRVVVTPGDMLGLGLLDQTFERFALALLCKYPLGHLFGFVNSKDDEAVTCFVIQLYLGRGDHEGHGASYLVLFCPELAGRGVLACCSDGE